MRKILTFFSLIGMLLGLILVGSASAQTYRVRLAHIADAAHPWHQGALKFKEVVERETDGRFVVEIFPGGALGGDRDIAEGIQIGNLQMGLVSGVLGRFYPPIDVLEIGFLIRNKEHLREVIYGDIGQDIAEGLREETGIRVLDWWERMPRHVTANREIRTLEDFRGLNIRVPEIEAYLRTWQALGANPTPIAFPELYDALRLGVVDAQENPFDLIYTSSFYEVVDYLILTEHLHNYIMLLISDEFYQGLPADIQEAIQVAAAEATAYQNQLVEELEQEYFELLSERMTVIEIAPEERQRMIEATQNVINHFDHVPGARDLYERVRAAGENLQ